MDNFLHDILIENFKSIQSCEINNCNRINLFIGRPNVGKSNIIEALSLFTLPFIRENTLKKLSQLIRVESETELFCNGNIKAPAIIKLDKGYCQVNYKPKEGLTIVMDFLDNLYICMVNAKLNVRSNENIEFDSPIKRYSFNSTVSYKHSHAKYLIPPYGSNLLNIIENYEDVKQEVLALFKEYNLEIAFDKGSQTIKVIQSKSNGDIFLIPYNSVADTLQRIIFFKAAIASNDNSILLFEEPEAHAFPPYMAKFTQDMINKKDNQFFIATHSPYILNDLLENAREELSVYMVDYQDKQTVVKHLSDEQLHDIYQYGVDLFTNSESFI